MQLAVLEFSLKIEINNFNLRTADKITLTLQSFLEEFYQCIVTQNGKNIIIGDFNINILSVSSDVDNFLTTLSAFGFRSPLSVQIL